MATADIAVDDDEFSCGICSEHFEGEGQHMPRLLSCGHSFCHSCLTDLSRKTAGFIFCPYDRDKTKLAKKGVEGLKKNFQLVQLLDKVRALLRAASKASETGSARAPASDLGEPRAKRRRSGSGAGLSAGPSLRRRVRKAGDDTFQKCGDKSSLPYKGTEAGYESVRDGMSLRAVVGEGKRGRAREPGSQKAFRRLHPKVTERKGGILKEKVIMYDQEMEHEHKTPEQKKVAAPAPTVVSSKKRSKETIKTSSEPRASASDAAKVPGEKTVSRSTRVGEARPTWQPGPTFSGFIDVVSVEFVLPFSYPSSFDPSRTSLEGDEP